MKTTEAGEVRAVLEARLAQLSDEHGFRETLAVEAAPDDLDRIQQASDRDFAVGNLQRNAVQLQEVQAALRRITAGTFGICAGCEESINSKRLAAIPWALCCIACQGSVDSGEETSPSGIDLRFLMAA